jgi:hypothetical protein
MIKGLIMGLNLTLAKVLSHILGFGYNLSMLPTVRVL